MLINIFLTAIVVVFQLDILKAVELNCNYEKESSISSLKFWDSKSYNNAVTLCEKLGYWNHQNPIKPNEKIEKEDFDACVELVKAYFTDVKVEKKDVEDFGKYCKDHSLNDHETYGLLNYLKTFCWKMSDIAKLPLLFNYKLARITPQDWNNLQFDNMQLQLCLGDVGSVRSDQKIKNNKIDVLENYIKLVGKVSKCSCVEIIGLESIFNKLNKNNEYSNLKPLYEEVCINGVKREKSITKEQLEVIYNYDLISQEAKSSNINLKKIIKFISAAEPIFTKGWYTKDDEKTQWPLTYLIKNSQINNEFNTEIINTVAEAIANGYSADNYDEFIKLTSSAEISKTIGKWDCRKQFFSAFNLDKKKLKENWYLTYKYENDEMADKTPNKLLKSFLDLNSPSTSCDDSVKAVKSIMKVFYSPSVGAEEMFSLLELAKKSNKNLDQFSECFQLAIGASSEADSDKSNLIKKPENSGIVSYDSHKRLALKDFRKRLFENQNDGELCKNRILQYHNNDATILKLFQMLGFKVENNAIIVE